MNPIQVNCPGCQKLFVVETNGLAPGQARFQCTSCSRFFAFNWPQPPEVTRVKAFALDSQEFVQSSPPQASASVNTSQQKVTQTCVRCGEKSAVGAEECPKCGVLFNKVKKIGPPSPVVKAGSVEVTNAWEGVRANFADEKKHEQFIQLCLNRDNLAYASNQYRAILLVNPSDELAVKMQNRIVELASVTYFAAHQSVQGKRKRKFGLIGVIIGLGAIFVMTGFLAPQVRSLIAVGSAFIAFGLLLQYWIINADE